jgi:Tfp pilus assembly protein PilV
VALFVFGVGILSVLGMITQNISTVQFVKTQTQATFLAKEGLEVVYNVRDSNSVKSLPWNCAVLDLENTNNQNTFCSSSFFRPGQSSIFLVQFVASGGYSLIPILLT